MGALPTFYQVKKTLMLPRTWMERRKHRNAHPFMKSMLELHYYRPTIYKWVGATVYDKHILHRADHLNEDSVVIDVGAYTGKWAEAIAERYNPTIYAFEPNPASYRVLVEKSQINPKIKPYEYGLGAEDASVEFTLNGLGSSMFEERKDKEDTERITVEIAAIDRIWKELELGNVDLVKINIEGAEFPLLDKMIEADLMKNVKCFMIQFHEWHPGAHRKRRRIQQVLSKTHKCAWDFHFVWEKWDRL